MLYSAVAHLLTFENQVCFIYLSIYLVVYFYQERSGFDAQVYFLFSLIADPVVNNSKTYFFLTVFKLLPP